MINRIASALRRRQAYNRTVRELSFLSDRDLRDVGLSRADIKSVARTGTAGY